MGEEGKPTLGGPRAEAGEADHPDWRSFVGSLLAAGVTLAEANELTVRQARLVIDAFKLRTYWAAMPMVNYMVSKIQDEDVAKALHSKGGNPMRGQLIENMLRPYAPSWMLEGGATQALGGKVIPGLEPEVAEAILWAIEQHMFDDELWRAVWPVWPSLLETAQQRHPPGQPPE